MRLLTKIMPWFRPPTADALARAELEDARRQLLAAHNQAEYARLLVVYQDGRVRRLTALLEGGK